MKTLLPALLVALAACRPLSPRVDAVSSAAPLAAPAGEGADELGKIDFPNSGAAAAQADFLRGVLLLHSFEYEDAAEAFRAAQAKDPGFALAYWAESLTYSHPIWNEDSPEKARAALERLAPTAPERLAKAPTERERGLLGAVELLWGTGGRLERNRAYARAMEALHARFPGDHEIAAFTSIAILGSSGESRDIPTYMRAAALAEEIHQENPDHPGAIHYAIHAYDDPVHAPLGLRFADRYAAVAPAAQHALHMPSHIYVALGMWQPSVDTNVRSVVAADARRARKGLGIDARGFHSLWWEAYSLLQLGRAAEAGALLADVVRDATDGPSNRTRYHLALMRAERAIALEVWDDEFARVAVDTSAIHLHAAAGDLFVQGVAALQRGEPDSAEATLAEMRRRRDEAAAKEAEDAPAAKDCCRPGSYAGLAPSRQAAIAMEEELEGLIAFARGDSEAGLASLTAAAAHEDEMGFDFGPPTVVKPAHELLGERLLELDRPADAAREFQAALERAPRRARSLLGLARAQRAAGDEAAASATYAELAAQWANADADFPDLAEVRAQAP
jgi:tetratricopeptide (TPR) repeat protein